jgi:hypothetical protein
MVSLATTGRRMFAYVSGYGKLARGRHASAAGEPRCHTTRIDA